jgi:hypothetical protein
MTPARWMFAHRAHFATCCFIVGGIAAALPASADERLIGSWKLTAFQVQALDTKETRDALGPKPAGRLIMTASGFITNFRVADGRKPAQNDADSTQLLRTMAAWTGRYRVAGDKIIVDIETSWNERVSNSQSERAYTIESKKLTWTNVTSSSNFFPGRAAIGWEIFERED